MDKVVEAIFDWLCTENFAEFDKEEFTPWLEGDDFPYSETRNKLLERIKQEISKRIPVC